MLKISIGIYAELAMIVSVALTQKNIPYQKNSYSCFSFKQRFMSYCRERLRGWGLRKVIIYIKLSGRISWVCECA